MQTSSRVTFFAALQQHARVISALLQREALYRTLSPLESFLALLEPLFLILVVSFAFWFFVRLPPYGTSSVLFLSTGFFPYYLFVYISRRMRRTIESPRSRFAVEQMLDYVLVHLILRVIDYSIMGVILFTGLYLFVTPEAWPNDIVLMLQGCGAMVLLGFGVGIANLALDRFVPGWRYIFPAFARILVLFSGVHNVSDFVSPNIRYILSFNPLQHAIHLFRMAFYPQYPHTFLDTNYLTFCAIAAVFLGLVIERATRRRTA